MFKLKIKKKLNLVFAEFLVSELQAAHMLKYKECNPEDSEPLSESGKEQRRRKSITDTDNETPLDDKKVMKELSALFKALDMDPASQFGDVYSQVRRKVLQKHTGFNDKRCNQ